MRSSLFLISILILLLFNVIHCATNKFLISHDGKIKIIPAEQEFTLKLFNLCKPVIETPDLSDAPKDKVNVMQVIYEVVITEGFLESYDSRTKQVKRFWSCPDDIFKSLGDGEDFSKVELDKTIDLY